MGDMPLCPMTGLKKECVGVPCAWYMEEHGDKMCSILGIATEMNNLRNLSELIETNRQK
jgi:hypothetical protein